MTTWRPDVRAGLCAVAVAALCAAVPAAAGAQAKKKPPAPKPPSASQLAKQRWLPNVAGASWTYGWTDSAFSKVVTLERYTVAQRTNELVRLAWTTDGTGSPPGAAATAGSIDYRYSDTGLVNVNWNSTPPPPQFPVLCANPAECGNSLAGAHYQYIWGGRTPVLQEPLVQGATWNSLGGQANDVGSVNRYLGMERVVVPAFPRGVLAAKVESDITQAGAIGDPHGSGLRTTWWVFGVGPVKSAFSHASGEVSSTELHATNLVPLVTPSDKARLPLRRGDVMRYRYTNNRHMRRASRQELTVAAVTNGTARVDVRELSGPIVVRGSYVFSTGLSGVRNLTVATRAATRVKFPKLGPRSLPAERRRRFFTPLDLMSYGYNPVVTAYPGPGDTWKSSGLRDRRVFGVTGRSKVVGTQTVRTPAGRYKALLVTSTLRQPGFPYGSGTRRMWFAAGVGLVRLEFRHGDGSVSRVERLPG